MRNASISFQNLMNKHIGNISNYKLLKYTNKSPIILIYNIKLNLSFSNYISFFRSTLIITKIVNKKITLIHFIAYITFICLLPMLFM